MKMSRRHMMMASLGLLLTGCSQTGSQTARRPQTPWPAEVARSGGDATIVHRPTPTPAPAPTPAPTPTRATASLGGLSVQSRQRWASGGPVVSRINPMGPVNRITVHHEGWEPFVATDEAATVQRLRQIQSAHVDVRGWADVGYHYMIDRSGRIWEGRNIRYQGAHVRGENPGNIGVMLLGNFDRQSPTDPQMQQLVASLRVLMRQYRVPVGRIYTHQELNPTACPGRSLQAQTQAIRSGRTLL